MARTVLEARFSCKLAGIEALLESRHAAWGAETFALRLTQWSKDQWEEALERSL